jgi:hypothetical protein
MQILFELNENNISCLNIACSSEKDRGLLFAFVLVKSHLAIHPMCDILLFWVYILGMPWNAYTNTPDNFVKTLGVGAEA